MRSKTTEINECRSTNDDLRSESTDIGHRISDIALDRRQAVQLLATLPLAGDLLPIDIERAASRLADLRRRGQQYQPAFFTTREWQTVRVLADLVIPADERSVGATAAGVPEFMDILMQDHPGRQTAMRGGLGWLDTECRERFGKPGFVDCTDAERRALLDDIAWPARARPEMRHGVAFFNSFRDLTASGFWSSKIGVEDLRYMGNTAVPGWNGCPPEQLRKLGVDYGE